MTGPLERQSRAAVSPCLLAVALALTAHQVWAVTCSVSGAGVSFGAYDTFNSQSLDGTGDISVSCDVSAPYTIALNQGGGSYASRAMTSGAHTLYYNLYTDAARTIVWGDGTASTATVSGSGTIGSHTVYGRIPARQNAYVGAYSDIITMTLTF